MSGCSKATTSIEEQERKPLQVEAQTATLESIIKDSTVLVVRQSNSLLLINPETKEYLDVYRLDENEIPLSNQLFDFKVSPGHKWIVWYSSRKGLLALNILSGKVEIIAQATEWFNRNPYFELGSEQEVVYWIDNNGAILYELNLETQTKKPIPIPYPFGNIFKVAPNNQRFLYITGYNQENAERPRFMFSDNQGTLKSTFASQVELSNRFTVEWSPDSQGILTLFNNQVWFYPYDNPNNPSQFVNLVEAEARDITRIDKDIFVLDSVGYWHRYEYETKKETARIPTDIARELRKPQFYPWPNQTLLITETSQDEENKFQRLWISNYRGQKNMVLSQFGEAKIATFSAQLD